MKLDLSLQYEPKRIISIVSPSRSGSTIIKHAIAMHPSLTSLAGEEEPYYKLAKNGYPWHRSDQFIKANNPELIRACISNEVLGRLLHNRHNRKWLQDNQLEEPPFVSVPFVRKTPTDTLLLKTPQNCYRRGVLAKLYPDAKVDYVVVDRDPRAIVNGLIDGWESPDFTARLVRHENGWRYNKLPTPVWWKFDMPPLWEVRQSIEERAAYQMRAAKEHIHTDYADAVCRMTYEAFCRDWRAATRWVWFMLGLPDAELGGDLPVLMATDKPGEDRWRTKRPWLEDLIKDQYDAEPSKRFETPSEEAGAGRELQGLPAVLPDSGT